MSEIKEGALVKVWEVDINVFEIGIYDCKCRGLHCIYEMHDDNYGFSNAIEIPADLAKQLEELGQVKKYDVDGLKELSVDGLNESIKSGIKHAIDIEITPDTKRLNLDEWEGR